MTKKNSRRSHAAPKPNRRSWNKIAVSGDVADLISVLLLARGWDAAAARLLRRFDADE